MSDQSCVFPSHALPLPDSRPAAARPAVSTVVLGWQPHPWWPVLHNLRRAQAARLGGAHAVLLVRAAARRHYRHALFPTDFSGASLALLRLAIAALPPMTVTLLHAYRACGDGVLQAAGVGPRTVDACLRRAERSARAAGWRFARQVRSTDTRLSLLALRQPWAGAVADSASESGADLLVLADGGGTGWRQWPQRARLRALLARTDCDVLLLPGSRH